MALEGESKIRLCPTVTTLLTAQAGDDAASFERALSALTAKINRATAVNDKRRQTSRRARVIWTLYAGFAYILAALLLVLVTGRQNWGVVEVSVLAGSPVV